MRWRGAWWVLLLILCASPSLATPFASLDGFTIGESARFTTLTVDPAAVYTIEFDLRADSIDEDARQTVILNMFARGVWGSSAGDNNIGGLGILQDGRAITIAKSEFGTGDQESFDEGPRPQWGASPGDTYHVRIVFDSVNHRHSYRITGSGTDISYEAELPEGADDAASNGLKVELGLSGANNDGEANAVGWRLTDIEVVGTGEAPESDGPPTPGDPGVPSSSLPWLPNLIDGGGFTPEASDPASTVRLEDPSFSFTSGGERVIAVPGTDPYERIQVDLDITIPDADPIGYIRQVVDIRNTCSGTRVMAVSVRTPAGETHPGQVLIDARGSQKMVVGEVPFEPGTYHLTIVYDLADSEAYVVVARPDGTVMQTVGGSLNTDATSTVRAEQTAGGVTLTVASTHTDPDQITVAPTGWSFHDLAVATVLPGEDSGGTGPDGADLETDDGRLAFLTATLARAAREEGNDWTLDCGPVEEVLPAAPSEEPDDAGARYCALQVDGDIVFGTFGTDSEGTASARILGSLQDVAYRLHVDEDDIDPEACDGIDSTLSEFQECPGAIDGMRTYAFLHPVTGSAFLVVSDSSIDAFDTSLLEGIGAFFRSLFGGEEDEGDLMAGIPLRRFHHAFLSSGNGREVAATWFDRDATLLYRSFVTDLSVFTPQDASYALGLGAQVLTAELDDDAPSDVRAWRQLTSGLRIADVAGEPIGGGSCGDGVIGLGEQCEPGLDPVTCGDISDDESDARPVACGASDSVTACVLDIASCGFGEGCVDDWVPTPRPLPCMMPNVEEEGDDPMCKVDVGSEECHEGFCSCSVALIAAVKGRSIDMEMIARHAGGSPSQMFTGGGSQNIAVMCRAARYYANGNDEDRRWFEEYFAYQRQHKHMGAEIMSPLYGPAVLGANVAVRDKALSTGHTALADGAGQWLRTTWAIISLGTRDRSMSSYTAQVHGNPKTFTFNDRWSGTTAAVPGSRHTPNAYAWLGFHTLIAYAAETSPRTGSPAYHWWPDHIMLTLGGTPADWDIGIPDAGTVTPETAGISAGDRDALRRMITSDQGFAAIAGMADGAKPIVPITFVRTSEGVMGYLGLWAEGSSDDPTGFNPSGSKAATFATRILADGSFRTLFPHSDSFKQGKERGGSWREGQRVCARAEGVTDCMDLPGGTLLMVAEWSEQGLRCVAGSNCGGDEPPGGGTCGAIVAAQGSYDILARVESGVPQIKVVYARDSPNGGDKEPACYRNGGTVNSDVGQITFPDQWIVHAPGSETTIYTRIKQGGDGHNDLKIVARADATGWAITGSRQGIGAAGSSNAARACWQCGSGSDQYCENMNVRVELANIPTTIPACEGSTSGGSGGGGCFIAGTPVETPQGQRPIESLRVGEQVIVYDTVSGESRASSITETLVHEVSTLLILSLDDGSLITTTPEHLFWSGRGWIAAGKLAAGDTVLGSDGSWRMIVATGRRQLDEPITVYNLHVADAAHDYFAGGVLVHNNKDPNEGAGLANPNLQWGGGTGVNADGTTPLV